MPRMIRPGPPSPRRGPQPGSSDRVREVVERNKRSERSKLAFQALAIFALGGGVLWWFDHNSKPPATPAPVAVKEAPADPKKAKKKDDGTLWPDGVSPDDTSGTHTAFGSTSGKTGTTTNTTGDTPAVTTDPAVTTPPEISAIERHTEILAVEKDLVLTGLDATRESNKTRDGELITAVIQSGAWDAYRDLLSRSLTSALKVVPQRDGRDRFDAVWKEPALYQAFLRWQVLGRFKAEDIREVSHDENARALVTWMLGNVDAMEEVLLTMKPEDDSAKVMVFLKDAWTTDPSKAPKYFNLALACGVVFDKPLKIHPKSDEDIAGDVDALERYRWYIEKDEKGKLAAPIDRSYARDLVYVVCAPVSTSELDWAIDKLHLSRKNFGDAYGMVNYLMERAVKGINPYKEYTFAEILKEGGICGDQSYFCANTARAHGIPAMIFAGETDLGGHAWVALKVKPDEWVTTVGRIGGVSKGETGNPQTGGKVVEQEVWLWADREHQSETTVRNVWRHLWLADYFGASEKPDERSQTVRLANTLGRSFPETWAGLYAVLEKETEKAGDPSNPDSLKSWKEFVTGMRREFRENPRMADLAAKAESTYIFPYGEELDAKRTLARERRRVERDSSEQKDLIADSFDREADMLVKRGGPDAKKDISRLYDRGMREYGGGITGFKKMADDYFGYVKDDPELAKKAVRDIELAFKRVIETGSKDWFRAKTEAGVHAKICGFYREVGENDRADMLEKRFKRLVEQAERGAL